MTLCFLVLDTIYLYICLGLFNFSQYCCLDSVYRSYTSFANLYLHIFYILVNSLKVKYHHYSLRTSLFSGLVKCPRLILPFPCLKPEISYIFKKNWLLLVESGIQKPRFGCGYARCYGDFIASRLFQQRELGNTYMYICLSLYYMYTCTHIHTYIYVYTIY